MLNQCKTHMGSRLLHQWLRQPLLDQATIEARLNVVEALVADTTLRSALRDQYLRGIPDLQKLSKRFQMRKGSLQDIVEM